MIDQFIATYEQPCQQWEDCLAMAALHRDKSMHYWDIAIKNHHSTETYMNATVEMEKHVRLLSEIERWCYSNVPGHLYAQVHKLMKESPLDGLLFMPTGERNNGKQQRYSILHYKRTNHTKTMLDLTEKYAPGLFDLVHQLMPFQDLIHGFTAGPQKGEADKPIEEYVSIQVPDIYSPSNQIWVTISRDTCCVVEKDGDSYEVTFQGLLNYLVQLPQPLHHFAR